MSVSQRSSEAVNLSFRSVLLDENLTEPMANVSVSTSHLVIPVKRNHPRLRTAMMKH